MPVSHKHIIKISVKGFFKNSVGLYNYHLCYYGSGAKKEIGIKITALPNVSIHCLLDSVVTCV